MAVAWFIAPYRRRADAPVPTRYCAMDDFTAQIRADGGAWSETEILGDRAIVKVRASLSTLQAIAGAPGMVRVPLARLDDPLSSLTEAQRRALRNVVLDAGYTAAELQAALPDLSSVTIGQVLRFMARRRLKPRYDAASDSIVCDGAEQPVKPVDSVDAEVA